MLRLSHPAGLLDVVNVARELAASPCMPPTMRHVQKQTRSKDGGEHNAEDLVDVGQGVIPLPERHLTTTMFSKATRQVEAKEASTKTSSSVR